MTKIPLRLPPFLHGAAKSQILHDSVISTKLVSFCSKTQSPHFLLKKCSLAPSGLPEYASSSKKTQGSEGSLFNDSQGNGNIGKLICLLSHILEILENGFVQLPHILEILDRTIHTQSYPGNSGSYDPYIIPILEISFT